MKLLLITITVALMASDVNGLKCYNCMLRDIFGMLTKNCSTEMTCPDFPGQTTACLKTSIGKKKDDEYQLTYGT